MERDFKESYYRSEGGWGDLKYRTGNYENIEILLKAVIQTCETFSQDPELTEADTGAQETNE